MANLSLLENEERVQQDWRLNRVERLLYAPDGTCCPLSEHELTLLEILACNCGRVVSRKRIASAFGMDWRHYDDRRLDQMISRLRRRWRTENASELPLRTEHGKGYCFTAEFEIARRRYNARHAGIRSTLRNSIDTGLSATPEAGYYLVNPMQVGDASAYIKTLQRQTAQNWRLEKTEKQLLAPDGTRFALSKHESTLLELLARHCGHVVSRKRIASAFGVEWINYDDRRLDQMVSRLRKRWLCHSARQLPFRTEYGKGYCFSAEIEVV